MKEFKDNMKADYIKALRDSGDNWTADYESKNVEVAIKLNDGSYLTVEKPRIQTRFCYGYGCNLISTQDEEERADSLKSAISNDEEFFINENLRKWDYHNSIELLESDTPHIVLETAHNIESFATIYRGDGRELVEKDGKLVDCYEPGYRYDRILTDEEKALYLEALKYTRESFIKRLKTYLKRYGLSKIVSWTYLVD